jgi:O-antigen/teichoic acid export membrane protein
MLSTLRKNSPAFFSVFVGLLNTVLIMRYLGANQVSDVYFLSFYVATVLTAFSLMPYEQFMHWHSYFSKTYGEGELNDFISNNIHSSLMAGVLLVLTINLMAENIAGIFGSMLNDESIAQVSMMLRLLSIGISTAPVIFVMRQYLNINNSYSAPFLFSVTPQVLISCFFIVYQENAVNNIHVAAIFYSVGSLILLAIFFYHTRKYGLRLTKYKGVRKYKKQYYNSIVMKGGGNVHYYSFAYFVTNFLSQLSPGAFSLYQYAEKIVSACYSISAGPIQNKYIVDISRIANSNHSVGSLLEATKTYLKNVTFLFIAATVISCVLTPYVAPYVSKDLTSSSQLSILIFLLVGLAVAKYINILESPSVIYLQSRRDVVSFYIVNGLFAFILFTAYNLINDRTVNVLLLIIIATNLISLSAYTYLATNELKRFK